MERRRCADAGGVKSGHLVRLFPLGATGDVCRTPYRSDARAKLKTPLQIGQHLVRAFEAGFEIGAKPIDAGVVEAVLSSQLNDLEPQLTRNGHDLRSLVEQFDAKPAEIRPLLRGDLDAGRSQELMDEMRAAGVSIRPAPRC